MSMRTSFLSAAVLSLFVVSGCGGGGGGGESTSTAAKSTGSGGHASGEAAAGTFGTSRISGKVTFEGTAPKAKSVKMDADPYCGAQHPGGATAAEYVVGPGGGLKWVFVYVKEGLASDYSKPGAEVILDQKGCTYEPHVFGIMVGQKLKILNSDETLHNIHSLPKNSRQFNLAMPRAGMELEQKFKKPEVMVRIKCDVHPWMESYAGVLSHPFHSVTGADGSFDLGRLPAGTYTIEAWHEDGGVQTQSVTVGEGESAEINFSFKVQA